MTLRNKYNLKKELENLKSKSKLTLDILNNYNEKDRKRFIDQKLLELNIMLTNWGLKNHIINEIDLKTDRFFTENENFINYVDKIGLGAIGAVGIGGGTIAFNIAAAPVFMGFGGGVAAIGGVAMVVIAAPIVLAGLTIYGVFSYKKNQYIKKLIEYFDSEVTKIFDFYNSKLSQIKIESTISLKENTSVLEDDINIDSNPKQIDISLEEKYKSTIALFGIYISIAKINGNIKDEYKDYIEYIKNSYINYNQELGKILDKEITKFINMDKVNLNELGFLIYKDEKINFGELEYENCFKLISLDYFLKKDIIKFLKNDLIQYFKLNENIYKEMAIKYLDYNNCIVYYCDIEKDIIIKYKDTERNKQNGIHVEDFLTIQETIFEHIFKLMRKTTIEIIFYGKKEYFDILVNESSKYADKSINIKLKSKIS
jgi:hypothetical protein